MSRRQTSFSRLLTALAVAGATLAAASSTATADSTPTPARPDHPETGEVWSGLHAGEGTACPHGLEVSGLAGVCTHGPDAAPPGVDVRRSRSTDELVAETATGTTTGATGAVPCYGDGVTGNRVQVVYAHAADVPDRYSELLASMRTWAASVDSVFADSAAETGGVRHVRWVTDAGCNLEVAQVALSNTGDDSYGDTVGGLQRAGLSRSDRKYLMLVDANVYCGISGFTSDDTAGSRNASNGGPEYSRVDSGCWGRVNPVEAHEIMHSLGGVQYSAPHSSGGAHCTDEYDRMCYAETINMTLTYPCASSHERLFDCNHDDYFSTAPAAGSYLANHWNAADSVYLEKVEPSAATGGTTGTTGTTSGTTATSTLTGSLSRKVSSRSYTVNAGTGTLTATLGFTKASTLTLSVRSAGSVVAQQTGPSTLVLSAPVSAGAVDVVVTGTGGSASYTLTLSYPQA
ncbi:MAG TPA: hypothetical protein VMZ73_05915 [Acidimicrobiales bacterium]|nr:hypothetical protein [Acidimicrobiales bacterium]